MAMVKRFVVTHASQKLGLRILTFPAQGRWTFETREEAEKVLATFAPSLREKVLGDLADTLEVTEVDCYPGHHDPSRTVF
jgi:hypothetical protein